MSRFVMVYVCMCVCMYVTNFRWHRTSLYVAVSLVLIAPLNCWRDSTPFWCTASLCTFKIGNFRTYHIARAYSTLVILVFSMKPFSVTRFSTKTNRSASSASSAHVVTSLYTSILAICHLLELNSCYKMIAIYHSLSVSCSLSLAISYLLYVTCFLTHFI